MIAWPLRSRHSPIGVDIGSRSVKLVQLSADHKRLIEAVRWDLPDNHQQVSEEAQRQTLIEALTKAQQHRSFRGHDVVLCLGRSELYLQNVRVPKTESTDLVRLVQQEAAGRLPFSVTEAELRFIEAADVRQGDTTMREVIVFACHRPKLNQLLEAVKSAGLNPVAVDVEPHALVRSYAYQYRRDDDRSKRSLLVHFGYASMAAVIAEGDRPLFIKYIDLGGRDFDRAVAKTLDMPLADAAGLRRNNGDRRIDQQDPEVAHSIASAIRPTIEKIIAELSMCIRYHSVTFRGHPLSRIVFTGGEATDSLREQLASRLDIKCELGEPLRGIAGEAKSLRQTQWDVAAGLAMRTTRAAK